MEYLEQHIRRSRHGNAIVKVFSGLFDDELSLLF